MVHLFAIEIMKHTGTSEVPITLCAEYELSQFGYFKRGTVKELVNFFMREVVQRTRPGERNVIDQAEHVCHSFVTMEGEKGPSLACAVVTDKDYPTRVALSLCGLAIQEFRAAHDGNVWASQTANTQLDTPAIPALLAKYQDPDSADSMSRIQKDLEDVREILHQSMDDLLSRGEKLDNIIEKSDDLSDISKQFLWQAQKQNECCSYW
eukprot:TRINITY_DN4668_c0_g1_i1.p1 TRINITY_DN4668_c0_g1~~TRINITY_DN4668_c0_g1_i1.p1  ORF type:complete len:208 (-),score=38.64 TRINITY_DN4668_c0_g1_i1:157-780(-)